MAYKIASARYGWVCGEKRDGQRNIVGVLWAKRREAAKPYSETGTDVKRTHEYLCGAGISHEMIREHVDWVDNPSEGRR